MLRSNNAHSTLQFTGYDVSIMSFSIKLLSNELKEDEKVNYSPKFERSIIKIDENRYDLRLSVKVGDGKSRLPFSASVGLIGHFELREITNPDEVMRLNATAILFPYLRATLGQLTTLANISTLTLPTFNIVEMFKDKEQQQDRKSKVRLPEKEQDT